MGYENGDVCPQCNEGILRDTRIIGSEESELRCDRCLFWEGELPHRKYTDIYEELCICDPYDDYKHCAEALINARDRDRNSLVGSYLRDCELEKRGQTSLTMIKYNTLALVQVQRHTLKDWSI